MDRGRQVIRQWKILRLLEAHRGLTVPDICERLDEECVSRTVRRDLEALSAAGFPLVDEDRKWRVLGSGEGAWSLPVEPTHLVALMVSEEQFAHSPLAVPIGELRERLEAMLPPRVRAFCARLSARMRATPLAPVRLDRADPLPILEQAVREQRRVDLEYWSPSSGETRRRIEPYLLWHVAGGLYVVAWDHQSGELRIFAVQRARAAELLDERFEIDPAFDPAAYLGSAFGVYHGEVFRVVVDFTEAQSHLIRERLWHPSQRLEDRDDGGVRATWHMAGLPEIARWLAGFGGAARVVAPRVLAQRVREIHAAGLAAGGEGEEDGVRGFRQRDPFGC